MNLKCILLIFEALSCSPLWILLIQTVPFIFQCSNQAKCVYASISGAPVFQSPFLQNHLQKPTPSQSNSNQSAGFIIRHAHCGITGMNYIVFLWPLFRRIRRKPLRRYPPVMNGGISGIDCGRMQQEIWQMLLSGAESFQINTSHMMQHQKQQGALPYILSSDFSKPRERRSSKERESYIRTCRAPRVTCDCNLYNIVSRSVAKLTLKIPESRVKQKLSTSTQNRFSW